MKEEEKISRISMKVSSPLRGLLDPLNIAASSNKTGSSKKTMSKISHKCMDG